MARRGRFGRLPRRAPDLTGAIVAMMREYWNTQENIMVSSWREGGEVDGKQVTDERLLEFWKERRDSVQKDDPLWDYYDQQHDQYKFAIEESKVGLAYAQHKMSAKEVANWYKGQGQNYVKNSEMYRTVMGQAAKFLDAAKASSRASSQERRQKAYVQQRNQLQRDYLWPSEITMGGLTQILQGYGILTGPQNQVQMNPEGTAMGSPEGEQLGNISVAGDVEQWDEVLAAINTPGSRYYDYWHDQVIPQARREGLDISAPFDQTDIDNVFQRTMDGYDKAIQLAKRFNDVAPSSELANLYGAKQTTLTKWQFMATMDEANIYVQNRKLLNDVLGDPASDPFSQMKAITDYYNQNETLMKRVGDQNPLFTSSLLGEQRALLGNPGGFAQTIWEGALQSPFAGSPTGTSSANGEAALMANKYTEMRDIIEKVSAGTHLLGKDADGQWKALTFSEMAAQFGGQFVVVPKKMSTVLLTPAAGQANSILPPRGEADPDHGLLAKADAVPITASYGMAFGVMPILSRARAPQVDPRTGREMGEGMTPADDPQIGMVAYLPDGNGQNTVPMYGIYTDGGELRWSAESPFGPGTTTSRTAALAGGQEALVVTGLPTEQTSINYIQRSDANGVEHLITQPTSVPLGPNDRLVETRYQTQSVISPFASRDGNPASFLSPGLGYMARNQTGREEMAGWTADETFRAFAGDPFIEWGNPAKTAEFWQDVGAVRASVQASKSSDPNARLNSEIAFYGEVNRARNGDLYAGDIWATAINERQRGLLIGSEVAERTAAGTAANPAWRDLSNVLGGIGAAAAPGESRPGPFGIPVTAGGPTHPGPYGIPAPNSPIRNTLINNTILSPNIFSGTPSGADPVTPRINVPTQQIKMPAPPTPINAGKSGDGGLMPTPNMPNPRTPTSPTAPDLTPPMLPPAPNPNIPQLPGVSPRPRLPHEWDPFGPGGKWYS